jgi:hypothetical protein
MIDASLRLKARPILLASWGTLDAQSTALHSNLESKNRPVSMHLRWGNCFPRSLGAASACYCYAGKGYFSLENRSGHRLI